MIRDEEAGYLFRRARKAAEAAQRAIDSDAPKAVIAAHREMAIRYKVRALAKSSGTVPSIDAALWDYSAARTDGSTKGH
jgi:hypothetical protein